MTFNNYKRVWFVLTIIYFTVGYLAIAWFNDTRSYYFDVGLNFERNIPFVPPFIFGYLLVYFSVLGLYFLITEEPIFKRAIRAFFALTTLHYIFFLATPVQMLLRPDVVGETGFSNLFVRFYYWLDKPYNCFPSLHVAYTLLGTIVLWDYKRGWSYLYLVSTIVVSVSVVLVKQHYISDVIGGLITPFLVWWLAGLKRGSKLQDEHTLTRGVTQDRIA